MNEKRRNHTVPVTYLKHFSIPRRKKDYCYTLELLSGIIHEDNIENASVEKDFYRLGTIENQTAWEDFYANEIEPRYTYQSALIKATESAILNDFAKVLSPRMRSEIAIIMVYQLFRGRMMRNLLDQLAATVFPVEIEKARVKFGYAENDLVFQNTKSIAMDEEFKKIVYAKTTTNPEQLLKYARSLAEKRWVIYSITTEAEFITSDNPIIAAPIIDSNTETGILDDASVVYYPISPKAVIAVQPHSLWRMGLGGIDLDGGLVRLVKGDEEKIIKSINGSVANQAIRQVYAKNKSVLERLKCVCQRG